MEAAADFSVLRDQRLIAYLWRRDAGHLRRAGAKGELPLAELAFGEVVVFDAASVPAFETIVKASADFDALLLELGLEGFDVVPGEIKPHARQRRF